MKVLLVNPPIEDFFFTPQRAYPLGLLSLGTVLSKNGFQVKIINCPHDYGRMSLPLPGDFSYLARYYRPNRSPFRLFGGYYRFGENAHLADEINSFDPAVVGVSANFSAYLDTSLALADLIKCTDKRRIVVMGGRAVTQDPHAAFYRASVDYIIRGEADFAFLALCRGIEKGRVPAARGVLSKTSLSSARDARAFIERLSELPVLDRALIDYASFRRGRFISTAIMASRGCGRRCSFCAINERFRWRPAKLVLQEMEECFALGIRHFNFEDDNINLHPELKPLIDGIIERFGDTIKISFMNGMLTEGIDKKTALKLKTAGLTHIDLAVASVHSPLRVKLQRRENIRRMWNLSSFFSANDVPATVHFILGFPGQSFQAAVRDVRTLSAKPLLLGPSIFYPAPGSRLFAREGFRFADRRFFRSSCASYEGAISRDRIFTLLYACRAVNFIKQCCDAYRLQGKSLSRFVAHSASAWPFNNDEAVFATKLARTTVGMILLRKLLAEYVFYRIEEQPESSAFRYRLYREDFASPDDTRRLLRGLVVKGLKGTGCRISSS